uniref:NADH dehydrogenase subunit 5 n=1 Tax=Halicephalobus mephisto TaxID=2559892 RepID=UPI002E75C0FA|nr:NADH dehydrogenase subunit 5 [Halicephalobus mephisto]WRI60236.1 NADH dehydrogenase subunit 5 [Halicephalobus mephisto]
MFLFCFMFFFICFYFSFFPLEWLFFSFKFNFYFNSLIFSFILCFVTLTVFVFSSYYLMGDLNFSYYFFVLLIFVFSMFMLNFSYNAFSMLLSWDLLGISSFFLVLYYNNWDSCSGAMNTVLTNRLGDFFIFVFFSSCIFSNLSFFSFMYLYWSSMFFLVLTSFTKSAQFPFSGWLPKAMSAPTPVSSLVHSSTLVTAGLLLLFNFSLMLLNSFILGFIFVFGIFTTFFSSISALVEEDLKKVVALSTLSQMGFSMMTFGLSVSFISLLHLLSHALFKSCLFMQVGYLIHCSFGQQDGRFYSFLFFVPNLIQIQLLITLFCLCGLFFTSGLVSKDLILEFFFFNFYSIFFCLFFFITVFLTFFYSFRLWKGLFLNFNYSFIHFSSSYLINFLSLFLCLNSIFFIWWINYNLIFIPSFFVFFDFFVPLFYLFLFFFLFSFIYKIFSYEFAFKFLGDYLPKLFVWHFKSFKFMENFLYNLSYFFINSFSYMGLNLNFFNYSNFFNSCLIFVFIFFIMM